MAAELAAFFERMVPPFPCDHRFLHLGFGVRSQCAARGAVHEPLDLAYVLDWRLFAATRNEPLHHADFTLMVALRRPPAPTSFPQSTCMT